VRQKVVKTDDETLISLLSATELEFVPVVVVRTAAILIYDVIGGVRYDTSSAHLAMVQQLLSSLAVRLHSH